MSPSALVYTWQCICVYIYSKFHCSAQSHSSNKYLLSTIHVLALSAGDISNSEPHRKKKKILPSQANIRTWLVFWARWKTTREFWAEWHDLTYVLKGSLGCWVVKDWEGQRQKWRPLRRPLQYDSQEWWQRKWWESDILDRFQRHSQ